jgi:hypothetical protein
MDAALEKTTQNQDVNDKMDSLKSIYQKNRNEKKPVKMPFEILSNYQQFFEVETVKTFTQKLNKK